MSRNTSLHILQSESVVMRMMQDERSKLTDQQIFTSPGYHNIHHAMCKVITGRTKIPVWVSIIWDPEDDVVAYATKNTVVINAAHKNTAKLKRRKDKHMYLVGENGHESGHVLFSDFDKITEAEEAFLSGNFYPAEPAITPANEAGVIGMKTILAMGSAERKAISEIYAYLSNAIEDGYVDKSMAVLFPGDIKKGFEIRYQVHFGDGFAGILKSSTDEDGVLDVGSAFMSCVLYLCKVGFVDFGSNPQGDIADICARLTKAAPRIRREVMNSNVDSRKELALDLILENWDILVGNILMDAHRKKSIAEAIQAMKNAAKESGGIPMSEHTNGNGGNPIKVFVPLPAPSQLGNEAGEGQQGPQGGQQAGEGQQGLQSGQQAGEGQQGPQGGQQAGEGQQGPQGGQQAGEGQQGPQGGQQAGEGQQGPQDGQRAGEGQQGPQGGQRAGEGQQGPQGGQRAGKGQQGPRGGQRAGEGQQGPQDAKQPSHGKGDPNSIAMHRGIDTSSSSNGNGDGGAGVNTNMSGAADNTGESTVVVQLGAEPYSNEEPIHSFSNALTEVEKEIAMEKANVKLDSMLVSELEKNARESLKTDTFATRGRTRLNIERPQPTPYGTTRYEEVWPKIRHISKKMQKDFQSILNRFRSGSRITGLPIGRRLHMRSLSRDDERYYQKKKRPNEPPRAACAILIDCSTSMDATAKDTSGKMLFYSKLQAASLQGLILYDFAISMGFPTMVAGHSTRNGVLMKVAASFHRVDKRDRARIAGLKSVSGNRDGTALNYVLTELMKRPEEVKFLFIVSDGLPNNYGGAESGVRHIQEVLARAKKEGVHVFASALKEDMKPLKFIYGDNMFEVIDLDKLPRTVIQVMKRVMKIK